MTRIDDHAIQITPEVTLAATSYAPDDEPERVVIISSGTGFPRSFYRHAAAYLQARGAFVVTYDYRGIADSASDALLQHTDLPDWAEDLDAVITWATANHPDLPMFHIGHSVGGHIAALSAQAHRFEKQLLIACGAGTLWQHFISRWPLELYFWWILGVFSLLRWGHIRPVGGWAGAPLPGPVFRTWRRWSHRSRYHAEEVESWHARHPDAQIDSPIEFWVFTDDGICTPRSAQTIMDCFPDADTTMRIIEPSTYGLKKIGHEGAFRKNHPLWEQWWESLNNS